MPQPPPRTERERNRRIIQAHRRLGVKVRLYGGYPPCSVCAEAREREYEPDDAPRVPLDACLNPVCTCQYVPLDTEQVR